MLRITSVAIALTIITGSLVVHAAQPDPKTLPNKPFVPRVHLSAGVGVYGASRYQGGGLVDILGLGRIKNFAFGANLQAGTPLELFSGNHFFSIAPTAGIFAPAPPWLQVGVLGSVGIRHYEELGHEFFGDPGFSATLPFAGLRGIAAINTGMDEGGWTISLHGFVDTDLLRQKQTYSYESWSKTEEVIHVAGRFQSGGIIALGITF